MRITIIGGHGKVALLLAPLLVEAGHTVTSVIRNPDHAGDVEATGAQALVEDIETLDRAAIKGLIGGEDLVVWSAGAGGGSPARTYAVDRDAAIRTIDACEQAGVPRFIMVSYVTSGRDDVPADSSFGPYAEAKAAADAHLGKSSLNWNIVGPGQLTTDEPSGRIEVGDHVTEGKTSRANVALVIAHLVGREDLRGATLPFVDGDVPIEEALAQRSA